MLKDVKIKMPDGVEVTLGMTVYEVTRKEVYSSSRRERGYIEPWSGKSAAVVTAHKVISINQAANSRSFIIRCSKGCEEVLSVKGQCIPSRFFGLKSNALKAKRDIDSSDIESIKSKIKRGERYIEDYKKDIIKFKKTISALRKQ